MEPLNKKERTTSFLQFLVMFLFCITFVVIAVFFDTIFFKKDYDEYKAKAQTLDNLPEVRNQINIIKSSLINMETMNNEVDFRNELDKVNTVKKRIHELTDNTNGLGGIIPAMDSIFDNSLRKADELRGLNDANNDIQVMKNNMDKLETQKKKLEDDLEEVKEKIIKCQAKCLDC